MNTLALESDKADNVAPRTEVREADIDGPPKFRTGERVPCLDGLRALSISMVVVGHLAGTGHCYSQASLSALGDIASLGVRVFFVISGFLITSLLLAEHEKTGTVSLPQFYFRRTLRIFPPFYALMLVYGICSVFHLITLAPGDLKYSLAYLQNYHHDHSWWVAHSWSLSVEEQFYLLWPFAFCIAGRRNAVWVATGVLAAAPLARVAIWYLFPGQVWGTARWFPAVADALASGCVLACVRETLFQTRVYKLLLSRTVLVVFVVAVVLITMKDRGRASIFVLESLQNVLIALIIDGCVRRSDNVVGRFLNSRLMVTVGVLSYSIYLWQQPFLNRYSSSLITGFPINLILVGLFAYVSYTYIEAPSLRCRKRLQEQWRNSGRFRAARIPSHGTPM
jgi:peptidoglycan/LPS O-acetylase OafA/YrhL